MSQNSRPGFNKIRSKIPRPVSQPLRKSNKCIPRPFNQTGGGKVSDSEFKTLGKKADGKPGTSHLKQDVSSCVFDTKSTSGSVESKYQNKNGKGSIADGEIKDKKELDCQKDEFLADEKALESILSNKGITPDLYSDRPSAVQIQSMKKSSIYYQSPCRMSLIDSHNLFVEKMKLLTEHTKQLNIKHGATPKSEKSKTPTAAASIRPVSLYYKMKPLQTNQSTPGFSTPESSKHLLKPPSLSERKELQPRDLNGDRLCHTSSKLGTKSGSQPSSLIGKENKCRFKLFSSTILEVPESTSSQNSEVCSSHVTTVLSSPSLATNSHSGNDNKLLLYSKESKINSCSFTLPSNVSSTTTSVSKDLRPFSEWTPSTPSSSLLTQCSNLSSTSLVTTKHSPIISATTASSWTTKNSICTPKSESLSANKITMCKELVTPKLQNINNQKLKDSTTKSPANTPSRIVRRCESLKKAPQRKMEPVKTVVDTHRKSPISDEFQADEKALESILSNKGITPDLYSDRPSAVQIQSMKKSSIYYQSPCRMSMIDSHNLFVEKMKLLKEHTKHLNIKHGATPKPEKNKTPTAASSMRPVSLYYKMKPLQTNQSTPGFSTPESSKHLLKPPSLSERKELQPRDLNGDRLCRTSSKLGMKSGSQPSSLIGKENKCRFKLFSSTILEVPESTSSQNSEVCSSHVTTALSSPSLATNSHSGNDNKLLLYSKEFKINSCSFTLPSNVSSTTTSVSKDLRPFSEWTPSTPSSSLLTQCSNLSSTSLVTTKHSPIISATTASSWTTKNSICTQKSESLSGNKSTMCNESVTPKHQNINSYSAMTPVNTPSRIVRRCESLKKAPQRIMEPVKTG